MFDPGAFEDRVLAFARQQGLFPPGERVVVGVSGGADSLCLLYLLWRRRGELRIELHAAHLNHGLRGEAGEADARFVAETCRRLELPATIETAAVLSLRRPSRLSLRGEPPSGRTLEEAARRERYRFLARVAQEAEAGRVAVGHTADDQVETVLLNLVRGAGLRGLRGMSPLTRLKVNGAPLVVARPLLEATRTQTEAYCSALNLTPRQDASNLSPDYRRNRLRREVLPRLRQLNPSLAAAVGWQGRSLREDLSFIEDEVSRVWDGVVTQTGAGIEIALPSLLRLHPALQRHLLLRAAEAVLGEPQDLASAHIEGVLGLMATPEAGRLCLPRGLRALREGERLWLGFSPPTCPFPPLSGEYPLTIPGETALPGWRVRAEVLPPPAQVKDSGGFSALLDRDQAGSGLLLRPRRPGDRFQPLGMEAEKKLQDFMVDARIPRSWRGRLPLVCSGERILWVAGYRIDHRVRLTPATRQVLKLKMEPTALNIPQ